MKKMIVALALMVVLSVFCLPFSAVAEQVVEVNSAGQVRVTPTESWRTLTAEEGEAVANPEKEIPAGLHFSRLERDGLFYRIPVWAYEKVVVYSQGRIVALAKPGEARGARILASHIVLLIISMLMMAVSNFVFVLGRGAVVVAVFAVVAAVAVFAAVAVAAVVAAAAVAAAAAVVAAVVVAAAAESDIKKYKIFSAVFYVLVLIIIFLL